ncbi:hypothetical protein [Plantactinospora veratri]
MVRTWSSLDPTRYQYFTDAHIHTGVPLYQTLVAAEILRSTEPAHDSLDGYDLRWTDRDTQRIEDNLIHPALDTFLFSQNRLWNQHLYGVIGMIAAAIFTDDADLYAERVEWFTVNSAYTPEIPINGGDVSGSLADLVRIIDADDPGNTTGKDFVQVMEMGRDQAHAEGDIDLLTAIARVVNNQGTRLHPVHGTVSTAADAVSPYEFLGNRILAGGDVFYAFMMGEDLPWVDTSGGQGKLAQGYRGRVREPMSELYLQYEYVAGVDVEREAPFVAETYAHRDGPLYYSGSSLANFWNESGSDFTGAEYWVAFPPQLAEQDVTVPAAVGPELGLQQFGHTLGKGAKHLTDRDGTGFVRLNAQKSDATVAVRRAVWPDRSRTALVGLKVRTNGVATLQAARTSGDEPFATIEVPDTHGRWRYVWMDVSTAKVPRIGDNIVYLTAPGSHAHIDVTALLADANGTLSPPVLGDGAALDVVAVAGEPYRRQIAVSDPDGTHELSLQGAPNGVRLAPDGMLTWLPRGKGKERGTWEFLVVASDDKADTTLPVTVTVARNRPAAIDALTEDLQDREVYTTTTWQPVAEARAAAEAAVAGTDSAQFGALLEDLRVAVAGLELLEPRLADGTLDYSRIVTSPDLSAAALAAIVDGDNQTFWGDIRRPSVLLDFGAGYRYRADAIGWQARDTFPDRSHGANAYGSNDGATWTLLTERPTEERRGDRDDPGPGAGTRPVVPVPQAAGRRADRRDLLHGRPADRRRPTRGRPGQPARRGDGAEPVRLLPGVRRPVHPRDRRRPRRGSRTRCRHPDARRPGSGGLGPARAAAVQDGRRRPVLGHRQHPVVGRREGRRSQRLGDVRRRPSDLHRHPTGRRMGQRRAAGRHHPAREGRPLPAAIRPRRPGRGMRLQGSADNGGSWQDLATFTGAKEGWNQLALTSASDTTALRLVSTTGNTNIAEVQLVTSTVDKTALDLYLDQTTDLDQDDWTAESWTALVAARTAAVPVADDDAADQARVDAAVQNLQEALAGLERR